MKSNAEMRKESYAVVRSRWFWIIFGVTLLLQGICQGAGWLLGSLHASMGIVSPADFFSKKLSMLRQGLDYTLPTAEAYRQMAYAGTLEMLVGYVLGAAFGGFGRPLGVTWLLMVMNFFVGLWMLLLIVPGIIAIYRYRAAWYLKSEHPDWGALKCLGESKRIMRGRKFQAFLLDMSFVFMAMLALFAALVPTSLAGLLGGAVAAMATSLFIALLVAAMVYLGVWCIVARTVFYREARDSAPCPAES